MNKRRIIIIVILLAVIAAGGAGYKVYSKIQYQKLYEATRADLKAKTIILNRRLHYEKFAELRTKLSSYIEDYYTAIDDYYNGMINHADALNILTESINLYSKAMDEFNNGFKDRADFINTEDISFTTQAMLIFTDILVNISTGYEEIIDGNIFRLTELNTKTEALSSKLKEVLQMHPIVD